MQYRSFIFAAIWLLTGSLLAQQQAQAFTGAHLIPIAGPEIENGLLVVQNGKILYAGPNRPRAIPRDAVRHDVGGKAIMPGMVDTHSHIGGVSGGDRSAPIQPDVRAMDAINVRAASFQKARAGGLTTVNIMPGSGHLMSGQTIYLKLRKGNTIDELFIKDADGAPMGGMKMANGTNSRRKPPFPGTRAKSAALVRQEFLKALEYRKKQQKAADDPEKTPERDLRMEGLLEVLDRKRVVHHHTHRHDDIVTVLRIAAEFNLDVVLHHVSDGWKVAEEIAAAKTPCSIILVDSPGGKLEAKDVSMKTGGILEKAGALVGFHTDDPITDSRLFLRSAGLAVRYGMSRQKALEGLTSAGAKMLRLDDRVGTLEQGKDADFVILSGDPLSVYTKVLETWVEGEKVFDRADPKDRLYAVGGYGAGRDQSAQLVEELLALEGE